MSHATPEDATLILRLYELRTDATMRKARAWVVGEFWPQTPDELASLTSNFGSQENAYFRQVISYWDMAVSFVARGALNADLFADSASELFFICAKLLPHVSKVRENNPLFMTQMEAFVNSSKAYQARVAAAEKNIARLMATRAAKAS